MLFKMRKLAKIGREEGPKINKIAWFKKHRPTGMGV
jgi:hypothetical protein